MKEESEGGLTTLRTVPLCLDKRGRRGCGVVLEGFRLKIMGVFSDKQG